MDREAMTSMERREAAHDDGDGGGADRAAGEPREGRVRPCWTCIGVGVLVGAAVAIVAIMLLTGNANGQGPSGTGEGPREEPMRLVPEGFALSESARSAIEAPWLTDTERAAGRIFHGVWDERDLRTPALRARAALIVGRFDDPVFDEAADELPVDLRAEAMFARGELQRMLELLEAAGEAEGSSTLLRRQWMKAEALWRMGRYDDARQAAAFGLAVPVDGLDATAGMLTNRAKLLELEAKLNGATEAKSREMMELLGRAHQSADRLYWPAMVEEGRILARKHNREQAVEALHGALQLNPRSAEAWHELGRIALDVFAFEEAEQAIAVLDRLDERHVYADLLRAELRLTEDDPAGAMDVLDEVIARVPGHRRALALRVAAASLMYDEPNRLEDARADYEDRSPNGAEAYYEAGRYLSFHRQYDAAAAMLDEAMRRAPKWLEPRVEEGIMHTQTANDARARTLLRDVVKAEPFNLRAGNALSLMEELLEFREVETANFIVRYKPGVDEVVAAMMPGEIERMHDVVAGRFDWRAPRKTIVELMPNHSYFAVRITGMPDVHTIAACTGPIVAMEVPREGGAGTHTGLYDWLRVLRHEYTHTVTLDLTANRIPHWLTEAAAVMMELSPREYGDCVMLAESWRRGTLFDLDEINWAFVRPKRPGDRGKAYAQGHWMLEFMEERYGRGSVGELLRAYGRGEREETAIQSALGVTREAFYRDFVAWAGEEVKAWGLAAEPSLEDLRRELIERDDELRLQYAASQQARLGVIVREMADRIGRPKRAGTGALKALDWPRMIVPEVAVTEEQLAEWREAHPDHPGLIEVELRGRIGETGEASEDDVALLKRYAELRPVDPYPHKKLAQFYLGRVGEEAAAIPHLERLAALELNDPVYMVRLARLYRAEGEAATALERITRALHIDPYDPAIRELAAAIAVEAGELGVARGHVYALTLLEPGRRQHERRLERLDELLARTG